jgi:superoxide dismutase, Fe-Mn family
LFFLRTKDDKNPYPNFLLPVLFNTYIKTLNIMNHSMYLKSLSLVLVFFVASSFSGQQTGQKVAFELPKLPYAYDALEPHIDAKTMEIHHSKHHAAYVNNLNAALANLSEKPSSLEAIQKNISKYSTAVRNNGGGHFNHSLFWEVVSPKGGGKPEGKLAEMINKDFGSFESFKETFAKAALGQFGSGWAWLIVQDGKLKVTATPNQDNPLMDVVEEKGQPLLAIDVWEHAYYLKYQNKRADYVNAFWNVVDWKKVAARLK